MAMALPSGRCSMTRKHRQASKWTANRIAVLAIILGSAVALGIGIPQIYLQYEQSLPHRTIEVKINSLAVVSMVLNTQNGNITQGPIPQIGFIFQNYVSHYDVSVINTGNAPVYLRQTSLNCNNTINPNYQVSNVPNDQANQSPGQSYEFQIAIDATGWQTGTVRCTLTATGDNNVSAQGSLNLAVISPPT